MTYVSGWDCPPQAYRKVSNFNYDIWLGSIDISSTIPNGKVSAHWQIQFTYQLTWK